MKQVFKHHQAARNAEQAQDTRVVTRVDHTGDKHRDRRKRGCRSRRCLRGATESSSQSLQSLSELITAFTISPYSPEGILVRILHNGSQQMVKKK
jgi:hypothetical protein